MSRRWQAIVGRIIAIGSFIGCLASVLGFFGIDVKAVEKAWDAMTTHSVLALLSVVFFLIFIAASYYLWQNSRITPENVEPRIREWLDAFSLATRVLNEPAHHFAYEVTAHTGIPLVVLRTKEHPRYITLISKMSLGPEHADLLNQLSKSDQKLFRHELILEAAKAKIGYQSDTAFENVIIEKRLPITSDLSEANLIDAISEVHFSALVILNTVALRLHKPPAN
jgi:hypothetical protein